MRFRDRIISRKRHQPQIKFSRYSGTTISPRTTSLFKALLMSIGMFSILPLPKNHWDDRYVPWVIPLMPIVGCVIGLIWYAVAVVSVGMSASLRAATLLLTPFVLSGFLHLDGFMDTADAFFSRRNLEERRRILKDSHVGAFAVISLVCLFMLQFCTIETIFAEKKTLFAFVFIPIVSRSIVGLLLLRMTPMSETGFAVLFQKNTGRRHWTFPLIVLFFVFPLSFLFGGMELTLILSVEIFFAAGIMFYLHRYFQGTSGDLCGCSITLSELSALLALSSI